MQEQQPGWQQRIGKVIRAELLERSDLNPRLLPQAEASLYQLQIELGRLETPPHARDDEQLAQALKDAMAQVREEQAQLETLEKQQKLLNQAGDEAARVASQARQLVQRLRSDLEFAKTALNSIARAGAAQASSSRRLAPAVASAGAAAATTAAAAENPVA